MKLERLKPRFRLPKREVYFRVNTPKKHGEVVELLQLGQANIHWWVLRRLGDIENRSRLSLIVILETILFILVHASAFIRKIFQIYSAP